MSSSSGTASTVSAPRAAAQHRFRCHRPMSTDNHPAQPPSGVGLAGLREAAAGCRACELWEPATQTVFGEGPETRYPARAVVAVVAVGLLAWRIRLRRRNRQP